jgi:hypothetical protein
MNSAVRWVRRHLPLILVLAAVAWVITIIVWITLNPVEGTGNPMD